MTRARRPRTRSEPDAIAALKAGSTEVDYTPFNWGLLIGAFYFHDCKLTAAELDRARQLLDRWRDQHHASDARGARAPKGPE